MKKINYLCRAQRTSAGLCASGSYRCLLKQHDFAGCVYQDRTTRKELYRETVYKQKKCLVKSGKDTILRLGKLYT